jgi:hypothetical protein
MRRCTALVVTLVAALGLPACADVQAQAVCDQSYPNTCIFPEPPDLDCRDIPHRSFRARQPDPHQFDQDGDGLGCSRKDIRLEPGSSSA